MPPSRVCVLFCLAASCTAALFAQDGATAPPKPRVAWETDYEAALQRAEREAKPVLVAFLMDDEPANDDTIETIYPDPDFVRLSAKFVCLACCTGDHEPVDGGCPRFPGLTCEQHQAIEKKARARWLADGLVCAPQHVFCDPKGNVVARKVYFVSRQQLEKTMAHVLSAVTDDAESRDFVAMEKARVDGWIEDSKSRNQSVRDAALTELSSSEDPRALPAILEIAKKGNLAGREAAIAALAKKGNFPAVAPLSKLLRDGKAQILMRVARTLEEIQMADATPALMKALAKERRDRVRGFLLRAAARSSPGDAAVREACLDALDDASAQLEPCVLVALGRLEPHAAIVAAVQPKLTDKNQNTRGLAIWVLGRQATPECGQRIQALLADEKTPAVLKIADAAAKRCRGEKVDDYETLFTSFYSDSDY